MRTTKAKTKAKDQRMEDVQNIRKEDSYKPANGTSYKCLNTRRGT